MYIVNPWQDKFDIQWLLITKHQQKASNCFSKSIISHWSPPPLQSWTMQIDKHCLSQSGTYSFTFHVFIVCRCRFVRGNINTQETARSNRINCKSNHQWRGSMCCKIIKEKNTYRIVTAMFIDLHSMPMIGSVIICMGMSIDNLLFVCWLSIIGCRIRFVMGWQCTYVHHIQNSQDFTNLAN